MMELHGRHNGKTTLETMVVVEIKVVGNHLHNLSFVSELAAIVTFPFQDAPKALHWPVVKAMRYTGHTLLHADRPQLLVENSACILESPVTVEQRVGLRFGLDGSVKGIKDELVVVAVSNGVSNDSPVAEVKDGAEVYLTHFGTHIVFELSHIGQPFQVRRIGMETATQIVFRHMLGLYRRPGAAMPPELNSGLDMECAGDTQNTFVVNMDVMESIQLVP